MNAFQIKDKEGKSISINKIDEVVAEFWGHEVQSDSYAVPKSKDEFDKPMDYLMQTNWYDCIGFNIANQGHHCSGWANVVAALMQTMMVGHFLDTSEGYKDRPVEVPTCKVVGDDVILPRKTLISIYVSLEYLKPYIDAINHFHSLGWTPHKIEQ